jgi:hypothetical protein
MQEVNSTPITNAMATATQGYMTDMFKTPGFFTAAIAADGTENPFDQAFKSSNETPMNIFDAPTYTQQPQLRDHADNGHNLFLQTSNAGSFTPLFEYPQHNAFSNPLQSQHIPSPPTSATQSPAKWQYNPFLPRQPPNAIATHNISGASRNHYGQVTPPDDQGPSGFDQTTSIPSSRNQHSQAAAIDSSSYGRRKRSTGSQINDTTTKSKRSRKSTGRSKSIVSEPTYPEDEKRCKFLERNRIAASKCRQKKKEWTTQLESRARELQNNKNQYTVAVTSLRDEVMFLKSEMLRHVGCGCVQIRDYLAQQSTNITNGAHMAYEKIESGASPIGSAPHSRSGSFSGASSGQDSRRNSLQYGDEVISPYDRNPHFKSERELEVLLTSQLVQDTSAEGIASRMGRAD